MQKRECKFKYRNFYEERTYEVSTYLELQIIYKAFISMFEVFKEVRGYRIPKSYTQLTNFEFFRFILKKSDIEGYENIIESGGTPIHTVKAYTKFLTFRVLDKNKGKVYIKYIPSLLRDPGDDWKFNENVYSPITDELAFEQIKEVIKLKNISNVIFVLNKRTTNIPRTSHLTYEQWKRNSIFGSKMKVRDFDQFISEVNLERKERPLSYEVLSLRELTAFSRLSSEVVRYNKGTHLPLSHLLPATFKFQKDGIVTDLSRLEKLYGKGCIEKLPRVGMGNLHVLMFNAKPGNVLKLSSVSQTGGYTTNYRLVTE